MKKCIFDNLEEWDKVIEVLEGLKSKKQLDSHQKDLSRLIRYNDNWRLREAAIEASCHVKNPTSDLIDEMLKIVTREDLYLDVRILATNALDRLFTNASKVKTTEKNDIAQVASQTLEHLTKLSVAPQPPIFQKALIVSHERIKRSLEIS